MGKVRIVFKSITCVYQTQPGLSEYLFYMIITLLNLIRQKRVDDILTPIYTVHDQSNRTLCKVLVLKGSHFIS